MGSREPREQSSQSSFAVRQSDGRNQQWAARGHLECWKGEAVLLLATEGSSFRSQRFARMCVTRTLPLTILKQELRFTRLNPCYTRVFPYFTETCPMFVCVCAVYRFIFVVRKASSRTISPGVYVNTRFVSILADQDEYPMAQYEPFRCTFLNDPRYTPQLRFANVSDSGADHHERETDRHWRRAGRTWSKVPRFRSGVFRGTCSVDRLRKGVYSEKGA